MIELIVLDSIGFVENNLYTFNNLDLITNNVTYAQWHSTIESKRFYEREPFQGRENDASILALVKTAADEVQLKHNQYLDSLILTPQEELERERAQMIVSRFQARAALYMSNLLNASDLAIQGADEVSKLAWQDAQEFRRNSPLVISMAQQLGITDTQLDDLFRHAKDIQA